MKFRKAKDYSLFNAAAAAGITADQMKTCLASQQGEEDAVMLYKRMAKKVKNQADREAFERLAGDEKRHSDVFFKYTGQVLRPNPTKAIVVPIMYRLLGREKTYHIIANAEYKAADKYIKVVKDFPEVEEVMNDEVIHGDAVLALLKK